MARLKKETTIGGIDIINQLNSLNEKINELSSVLSSHIENTANRDVHRLISDGNIIEEYGSNSNGEYIRFSNGRQICYGHFDVQITQTRVTNNIYHYFDTENIPYPAGFIGSPQITVNYRGNYVTGGTARLVWENSFACRLWFSMSISDEIRNIQFIAIGRWR